MKLWCPHCDHALGVTFDELQTYSQFLCPNCDENLKNRPPWMFPRMYELKLKRRKKCPLCGKDDA